jgi:hypothetical protein
MLIENPVTIAGQTRDAASLLDTASREQRLHR